MERLLSVHGTADRFEWWWISIISSLLFQISLVVGFVLMMNGQTPEVLAACGCLAAALLFLWLSLAVTCRRLRDRKRTPWLGVLCLIPYLGWLWLVAECGLLPGANKPKRRKLVRRMVSAETNQTSEEA